MKLALKILLPLIVIAITSIISYAIIANKAEVNRSKPRAEASISVETIAVSPRTYTPVISSFGIVSPQVSTNLFPRVNGTISAVSEKFSDGNFFSEGDVLLTIDPRDYQARIVIAESELQSANLALAEEQARVDQAVRDWKQLANSGKAPDLVLRKPQLAAAKAKVEAAKANVVLANLDLERTQIKAPYDGQVLKSHVDIGQVVSSSTLLAEVFATDAFEVRLPIKDSDLPLLALPESPKRSQQNKAIPATLTNALASPVEQWPAVIARSEGAIDQKTQQLTVVAEIKSPFAEINKDKLPLKVGQYLSAKLQGRVIPDALVIPIRAVYEGNYVYIAEEDKLQRREISVLWQNDQDALVSSGLQAGDELILTTLGQVYSGTKIKLSNANSQESGASAAGDNE